jgi:Tfp pilus assembly protein PilV
MTHEFSKKKYEGCKGGFSLIEALIAASIITFSILAIVGIYSTFVQQTFTNTSAIQAYYLADEGIEALKSMRNMGWTANISALTTGTPYRFYFNNSLSRWEATTSTALIDNTFDRTFTLASAYRDTNENFAGSGTMDADSRLVTVNVSWRDKNATSTKTLMTYLTNLFNN